jgi:oxepin-CoA hydrolase/3-oxo-5,6-dehydrosuberyl-CoA semialdehyde dehydrogenase
MMLDSGLLPAGALQLVSGGLGDMLDHLDCQDAVAFTGSAYTALKLRGNPRLMENSVRFASEQDSLNASVLGPDAVAGTPEFDLFVKEVQREMTAKAGQKCTAIRRIMVPEAQIDAVIVALSERLAKTAIGDPRLKETRMGALVSASQKRDVLEKAALIGAEAEQVFGDLNAFDVTGADKDKGAFVPPMLFHCADPDSAQRVHDTEAFGPVSTLMPYRDLNHAVELLNKGKGSLVASIITNNNDVAREITLGSAAFHGRLYFNNRTSMAEATGHGAPLPHMVHGGPGRAGGGEELGGIRGVMHYMQRTAIQGSPDILTAIGAQWVPGAVETSEDAHPFTRTFNEVSFGETFNSPSRTITLDDIETFAHFTGDTFYAHMDEEAAKANPFFPGRVAHGYLLLSFAAGLFVQPDPGPVLANTGLDNLRFMAPVAAGDSIRVRLTVKHKTPRNDEYGEVRWHVTLYNQDNAVAAEYELLTMNAY